MTLIVGAFPSLCAAIALVFAVQQLFWRIRRRLYPPGPPGIPLIGNLHQIPVEHQHLKFMKWGRTYGMS